VLGAKEAAFHANTTERKDTKTKREIRKVLALVTTSQAEDLILYNTKN
jgi:hypothetical protein